MRNNPGGVLGSAVDVSDAFLKGKKRSFIQKGRVRTQCMNLFLIILI